MFFSAILLVGFTVACGVKGDPVAPKGSVLPSYLENYPDIDLENPPKKKN